ncbi:MAG TPA: hypothetical protein VFG45_02500 [Candidatus Nitrosocosmicus sp.]|nr:hypothetical protein [Candidatus Nitrosocosmicus sp.]
MNNYKTVLILIDIIVLILASLLAILFLSYDYDLFGLKNSPYILPKEFKEIYDYLPWALFLVLIIDLTIKLKLTGFNHVEFLGKYWVDILLTLLITLLFPIKFAKPIVKVYKSSKITKSGIKIYQKYLKVFRHKTRK